jgi:AcrR family transcriptional regulator
MPNPVADPDAAIDISGAGQASARNRILAAAYHLFLRQGFHGTSVRQVARQAGLTPAAIYNHFPNKEAIFVQLLSDTLPQRALIAALGSAEGVSVEDLVHDAFRRMEAAMAGQFENLRLMFSEMMEFQGRHAPALAAELLPGLQAFFAKLQAAQGVIRPMTPVLLGRAFVGLFMSYAITVAFFRRVPGLEPKPQDVDELADIFLHGVLEPSGMAEAARVERDPA